MKSLICIIIFFPFLLFSQEGCDTLMFTGHHIPNEILNSRTSHKYIYNRYQDLNIHINNRRNLKRFDLLLNADNRLIFKSQSGSKIEIEIGLKTINGKSYFYELDNPDKLSFKLDDPEKSPFGITFKDTVVSLISSLKMKAVNIPEVAYSDLLDPNLYETFGAIKPIQVFESFEGKYIYIYLFGRLKDDLMITQKAFEHSYMAKIILSSDGEYIGRFVERGNVLNYFGFFSCPNFIGF